MFRRSELHVLDIRDHQNARKAVLSIQTKSSGANPRAKAALSRDSAAATSGEKQLARDVTAQAKGLT
jgi:hypothetical protein